VDPPPALKAALAKNISAKSMWDKLSYTHKKEHANAVSQGKHPETRARRIQKILANLTSKS
jgi:uncharacterized protein YdeI (YjbR/CyaY-like superfamily)